MLVTFLLALAAASQVPQSTAPLSRTAVPPSNDTASAGCPICGRCDARTPVQSLPGSSDSLHVIDAPGSYYLTDNVSGASGKNGIKITASHVVLDLNGFALIGSSASHHGVLATSPVTDVIVRNGSISGWGNDVNDDGIDLTGATSTHVLAINASGNGGTGIKLGVGGVLESCCASNNGFNGFYLLSESTMTGCSAVANGEAGFMIGGNCTVSSCTARGNGFSGFFAGSSCTVTHSTSLANKLDGFMIGANSGIDSSTSVDNEGAGIVALEGTAVVSCSVGSNHNGGINAFDGGCQMTHCEVNANLVFGIFAGGGCQVSQCSLKANQGPSIQTVFENCTVTQNDCSIPSTGGRAGTIGILVDSTRSRIEANSVSGAEVGLRVAVLGNLVVRNSAAGTATPFDIVPGNTVGPIVDSTTIATSSNPHANYRY